MMTASGRNGTDILPLRQTGRYIRQTCSVIGVFVGVFACWKAFSLEFTLPSTD
jgi:hypothetical protein